MAAAVHCGSAPLSPRASEHLTFAGDAAGGPPVLPGSYLVAFRPRRSEAKAHFQNFSGEQEAHLAYLDTGFSSDPRVKELRFLSQVDLRPRAATAAPSQAGRPLYLEPLAGTELGGGPLLGSLAQVDFTSPDDAASALREWDEAGSLWFAEPNYISRLSNVRAAAATPASTNVFQQYGDQYRQLSYWWVNRIDLAAAFSAVGGRDLSQPGTPSDAAVASNRPIIAVFDSGIDYQHPALAKQIWLNSDPNVAGCSGDLHGCNTTAAVRGQLGNGDVWPYGATGPGQSCLGLDVNCEHGTHVAGIIAGDPSWSEDLTGNIAAGVCPVCQLMVLKVVGKVGNDSGILDSSIVAAFKYISLFRRGGKPAVRVVNASFGKFARSRAVNLLLQEAKESGSTLVVAAAGNEDSSTPEYPAAFYDAVGVAAVDSLLRKLPFSNFGRWVSLSAPGDNILSTVPGGSLDLKSGTSMAAPMVAGVAGLMLARFPTIGVQTLRTALLASADPSLYLPSNADGYNYTYYYPQVRGQTERLPLLGQGVLLASGALAGKAAGGQPAQASSNRVRGGCGLVGLGRAQAGSAFWPRLLMLLVGLAPLAVAASQSEFKPLAKKSRRG